MGSQTPSQEETGQCLERRLCILGRPANSDSGLTETDEELSEGLAPDTGCEKAPHPSTGASGPQGQALALTLPGPQLLCFPSSTHLPSFYIILILSDSIVTDFFMSGLVYNNPSSPRVLFSIILQPFMVYCIY